MYVVKQENASLGPSKILNFSVLFKVWSKILSKINT